MSDTTSKQYHTGPGDNVAGDKTEIIFQSYEKVVYAITPKSLQKPVESILQEITNRNFDEARRLVTLIESMGSLESEVQDLLIILKIKCNHTANEKAEIKLKDIKNIVVSSENNMLKDLALSLLITIEFERNGLQNAKEIYEKSTAVGTYSRAVASEILLCKEELLNLLDNEINNISEEETTGLINGLIRTNCFDEAIRAANYLQEYNNDYNSNFILFYTKAIKLNSKLLDKDYWKLKQSEKEEVDDLITETLNIYGQRDKRDARLFNIIFPSFNFTKSLNAELLDVCRDNIDLVEFFIPEYADDIRINCKSGIVSENHPTRILEKALGDNEFKEKKIKEILNSKEVEFYDFWIVRNLASREELQLWIKSGIIIKGEFSELERKLNKLSMLLLTDDSESIEENIIDILETTSEGFPNINSDFLKRVSQDLCNHGQNHYACDLLLNYFKDSDDIWCSPLIEHTTYTLASVARYKDLLLLLKKVNDKDKKIDIFKITIWSNLYHGSPEEALNEIQKTIKNNDLELLLLKLKTINKLGKSAELRMEINAINNYSLRDASKITLEIIKEIITIGEFNIFEQTLADWFIESPENNYIYITQACFELLTSSNAADFKPSYSVKELEYAIQYSDGDTSIIKIISSNNKIINRHIIHKDSLLAKAFSEIEIGGEITSGVKTLKLENKYTPFEGIKSLSAKIRDEANDGSDAFQIIKLSPDPEVMMKQIHQALPQNKIDDTLFSSVDLPLAIRAHFINRSDQVKAAMMLLFNNESKFKSLINDGRKITDSASTDIITIIYLCFTSLSEYFIHEKISLYLIEEDIQTLSEWINLIDTNKFMTLSKVDGGKIFSFTSEHIRLWYGDLVKNLRDIIPLLKPLEIILDNYDKRLTDNVDIYSPHYIKSLYAIKNSSHPLLSIDTQNSILFHYLFNITPGNSYDLLHRAAQSISYKKREMGVFMHATNGLPYPLSPSDIHSVAESTSDLNGGILSRILNKYMGTYNDHILIANLLASVFGKYYYKSILSYTIPYKFKNHQLLFNSNPYGPKIDKIFNLCCSNIINQKSYLPEFSREEKLVNFLLILGSFHFFDKQAIDYIHVLTSGYAQGHFLDLNEIEIIAKNMCTR